MLNSHVFKSLQGHCCCSLSICIPSIFPLQSEDGRIEERLHEREAEESGNMTDHVSSWTRPVLVVTIIYQAVLGNMCCIRFPCWNIMSIWAKQCFSAGQPNPLCPQSSESDPQRQGQRNKVSSDSPWTRPGRGKGRERVEGVEAGRGEWRGDLH